MRKSKASWGVINFDANVEQFLNDTYKVFIPLTSLYVQYSYINLFPLFEGIEILEENLPSFFIEAFSISSSVSKGM